MKKPVKVDAVLGIFGKQALFVGLKAINHNSDVLLAALHKIDELEERVRLLEGRNNEKLCRAERTDKNA